MANTREPDPAADPDPVAAPDPDDGRDARGKGKRKRWREHKSERNAPKLLGKHMIPVVLGPDEHHYVVDHHHLARALHDEGVEHVLVTVIGDLTMVEREAFWGVMDNKRWAYPYDAKGERRHFKDLPKSVPDLKDDPFRSLARRIAPRRRLCKGHHAVQRISVGGFCAAKYRARAWRLISTRRWRRRSALPGARDAIYLPGWCGPGRRTTIGRVICRRPSG